MENYIRKLSGKRYLARLKENPTVIIPTGACEVYGPQLPMGTDLLAAPPDFYTIAADAGFGDFPYALWLRLNGKIRYLARFMSRYRLSSGADSWSADQEKQTSRRTRFFRGVIDMLTAFKAHTEDEALLKLTDAWIDRWTFQLLYTLGRDRELRKPPYRAILREKPLAFRTKNFVKCAFPALHRLYRRQRGYNE